MNAGARPSARAALWLAVLGPFFFLSYGLANTLAGRAASVPSVVFGWEHGMPFWPWTIVPYWSIDVFYAVSFFTCRTRRQLDTHALRLFTAQLLCVSCFLLWPLRYSFVRPDTEGVFGWLFAVLLGFDKPYNQAPSLHIVLLVVLWVRYGAQLQGVWRWLLHAWFALIGVSVLTTYQHHFIDVPTGLAAGWLCVWLWPERIAAPWTDARLARDPRRWRLAALYLGGAGVTAGLALWLGGAALWLLWMSGALLLVALNYALLGPGGFQKRSDGQLSLAARWLYAPYLLADLVQLAAVDAARAVAARGVRRRVVGADSVAGAARCIRGGGGCQCGTVVAPCACERPHHSDAGSGGAGARQPACCRAGDRGRARAWAGAGVLRAGLFAQCGQRGDVAAAQPARVQRQRGHGLRARGAPVDRAGASSPGGDCRCVCRRCCGRCAYRAGADMTAVMTLASMRALLRQGAAIDRCALLLLAAAVLLLGITDAPTVAQVAYALSALAGLAQRYWAFRVGLDADLLDAVLGQLEGGHADDTQAAQQLDQALQDIGLLRHAPPVRDWAARWRGMRGLLCRQLLCAALQVLALAIGLLAKGML